MTNQAIDRTVYIGLRDTTGSEFVVELVDTFLEEAPLMLADLRQAWAEGDVERFRRAAHSLKSNSNTFGAVGLAALARELELKRLDSGSTVDVTALDALQDAYERVALELRSLRDE